MLPSMRAETGRSGASSGGPEFDAAMRDLLATRKLRDQRLIAAAKNLAAGRIDEAKRVLAMVLTQHRGNPDALNLAAEIAGRAGQYHEAERLLSRCVEAAPGIAFYRYNHVLALEKLSRLDGALAETAILLADRPHNLIVRELKASLLRKMGSYADAAACYRALTADYPESSYVLKDSVLPCAISVDTVRNVHTLS